MTGPASTLKRALRAALRRSSAVPFPPLERGKSYVCLVAGPYGARLAALVFVERRPWVDDLGVLADGVIHSGDDFVFAAGDGSQPVVSREDVLWPSADHVAVRCAVDTLGLPLLPTRRRPAPTWRLGAVEVDARSMAVFGRALHSRRSSCVDGGTSEAGSADADREL